MPASLITRRELNRATLARQGLLACEPLGIAEAVERFGALQAQEARPPFAALWSRVEGFGRDELVAALTERAVVRATWVRATLHLVSAQDYLRLRTALAPMLASALSVLRGRDEGLDLEAITAAARELLAERGPLPFADLRPALQERFPGVNDRALGYATRTQLPLVVVPTGGTWAFAAGGPFESAETWLGAEPQREPDPASLVRRHLGAFGPASVGDVQAWTGLGGLAEVIEGMRDELEAFTDERGRSLFDLPHAPRPGADVDAPVRLLPEFDSLVLAHDDRSRVIADEHRPGLVTKNLRVRATFLLDGFVAGTWSLARRRGVATLTLEPFEGLAARPRRALEAEAERLLAFLEEGAKGHEVSFAA